MPQPAGPQNAETFVGRSHELAVLSAARQRLTALDEELAEAEAWHDTERAPAAATHLDQSVRTGTRCSYSPPDHPS